MTQEDLGKHSRGVFEIVVGLTAAVSDKATVVVADLRKADGTTIRATASTSRAPGDKFDARIGVDIATARVLRALADQIDQRYRRSGVLAPKSAATTTPAQVANVAYASGATYAPTVSQYSNGTVIQHVNVALNHIKVLDAWHVTLHDGTLEPSTLFASDFDAHQYVSNSNGAVVRRYDDFPVGMEITARHVSAHRWRRDAGGWTLSIADWDRPSALGDANVADWLRADAVVVTRYPNARDA